MSKGIKVGGKLPRVNKPIFARFFNSLQDGGLESFGLYYSYYRGIVYNRKDPEKASRLQLIIPAITGDIPLEEWAHPIGVFSGKGYGKQELPKEGDIVWVTFEQGNPEFPLWQHGYFGTKEKPTGDLLEEEDSYWFISPGGHKVIINDTKDTISIQHAKGQKVNITPDYISLISDKKISLGTDSGSKEPGVLGDTNAKALKDLAQGILDIINAFSTAAVSTDNSGATFKANLMAALTSTQTTITGLKSTTIDTTKSKKITLD